MMVEMVINGDKLLTRNDAVNRRVTAITPTHHVLDSLLSVLVLVGSIYEINGLTPKNCKKTFYGIFL
jgi:hypothetical protein